MHNDIINITELLAELPKNVVIICEDAVVFNILKTNFIKVDSNSKHKIRANWKVNYYTDQKHKTKMILHNLHSDGVYKTLLWCNSFMNVFTTVPT